jgi:hypothetical protein
MKALKTKALVLLGICLLAVIHSFGQIPVNSVICSNQYKDINSEETKTGINITSNEMNLISDKVEIQNGDPKVSGIFETYNLTDTLFDINGFTEICKGNHNVIFTVNHIEGANYVWSYSGHGAAISAYSDSISINFADTATSGTLKVTASGPDILTQSKEVSITLISCAQAPSNGLVAYYPFNGNVSDESGSGNNGIVNGASLTTDRFENPNSAYYFNGVSDFIKLPGTFDLPERTVNLWFNTYKNALSVIYENDGPSIIYGQTEFDISSVSSTTKLYFSEGAGNTVNINILTNTWYMGTITVTPTESKYYLDGVLFATVPTNSGVSVSGLINPFLGTTRSGEGLYFNGKIDDVGIYNRALDSAEIVNLFNASMSLGDILGQSGVCGSSKNVNYNVNLIKGANYTWTYSGTGTKITGNLNAAAIDFADSATNGTLKVTVSASNILTQSKELPIYIHSCHYTTYDTINVYETTHIYDTIVRYDTVRITDIFNVYDTVNIYNTYQVYDTIKVYKEISVSDTLIFDAIFTGLNPPQNHNFIKVYPNPTRDWIIIDNGDYIKMAGYMLKIINSQGSIVFESLINTQLFNLDLSTFGSSGTYLLQILDPNSDVVVVRKIILQ